MAMLEEKKALRLLKRHGIPSCRTFVCKSFKEAEAAAKSAGYPVVLKASGPELVHKTDSGAVFTGIQNRKGLFEALAALAKNLRRRKIPKYRFIIQPELKGVELLLGMKRDPQFGPVIAFGSGGILVELIRDRALGVAPLTPALARRMIESTKAGRLLSGFRGKKRADIASVVRLITALSRMSMAEKDIVEMDFNPVIAGEGGALVVDARIITS